MSALCPMPVLCLITPIWYRLGWKKPPKAGQTKVLPLGALTQGLAGEQLASMVGLMETGCVALSNARAPFKTAMCCAA